MSLGHLTLTQPMWLAAALLPILAAWRARQQRPRRMTTVVQAAALLLLCAALAEPTLHVTSRQPLPLLACLDRALQCFTRQPQVWRKIQLNGMAQDWSWRNSAKKYVEVYARAQAKAEGVV